MTDAHGIDHGDASPELLEAVTAIESGLGDIFTQFRRLVAENANRMHPGMMPGTYKVFTVIARMAPVTAKALAEHMELDKAQVSRTIRELEELDLVTRSPDPRDGRAFVIEATPEALARLDEARSHHGRTVLTRVSQWPLEDAQRLGELLHRLTRHDPPQA